MSKMIDETGNRHGRWTVLKKGRSGRGVYWWCRCDCGTEKEVIGWRLRNGTAQSCGCLHFDLYALPKGEASFNRLIYRMKSNARQRKIEWDLTRAQVATLTKQNCHYCGVEPKQLMMSVRANGGYLYNSLDRVDNDKGYIIDNVVPCCWKCNRAKMGQTVEELMLWVRRIYEYQEATCPN